MGWIFRSTPRVSLLAFFPFSLFGFSLFPYRDPPRFKLNTHHAIQFALSSCCVCCVQLCALRGDNCEFCYTMVEHVIQVTSNYEAWLAGSAYVSRFSFGHRMLKGWRWAEQIFLDVCILWKGERHSVPEGHRAALAYGAVSYLRSWYDVVCGFQGTRGILMATSKEGCWRQVQSLLPINLDSGSSTVISPSRKLCS